MGEGRSSGERLRYTVEEAAAVLGMTTGAVRNRLSRGTLRSVEEHGTVYVLLPADTSRGTAQDTARDTGDIPGESRALMSEMRDRITSLERGLEESSALVSQMRERIAFLERERITFLEREREESSALVSEMRDRIAFLEQGLEESSALVSQMRERIAFLERERERKDAILLNIAEAMKDISSPTEQPGRVGPQRPLEGAQERRSSWWSRIFGG